MQTATRIFNFSAGPAVLPVEVLEEAQRDLVSLPGVGMSVLEISHRSKAFDEIIQGCEAHLRALAGISSDYHVLFLQGGASLQFSMVPMNLLPPGGSADYIVTGVWSQKAVKEAKRVGTVKIAGSTESDKFNRVPKQNELTIDPAAAYVHFTTNNTIYGTEWHYTPEVGNVPLVADASSDIFSRPIQVSKHALIYAGAQKNLAPAGVTLVIARDDIVKRSPSTLPTMMQYSVHAENKSLYNTPPVFAIYVMRLVLKWLLKEGGLAAMEKSNVRKAAKLYAEIDRTGFYRGHAQPDSRSRMNVTFRLPSEELEKKFVKEATAAGLDGLARQRQAGRPQAIVGRALLGDALQQLLAHLLQRAAAERLRQPAADAVQLLLVGVGRVLEDAVVDDAGAVHEHGHHAPGIQPQELQVLDHDAAHDRQAQPAAAALARAGAVDPVEALEQLRQRVGRDAAAGVAHQHANVLAVGVGAQADVAAGLRILAGVVEQVQYHLAQPIGVAVDPQIRRHLDIQTMLLD